MIELTFLALLVIFTGIFILKFLFFILGLIFTSVGLFLKVILTLVFGLILFPLGTAALGVLFSGGFIVFLLIFMGFGALISEKKRV